MERVEDSCRTVAGYRTARASSRAGGEGEMTAQNAKKLANVLVGTGRFADPWHDFAGTGAAVAEALEAIGMSAQLLEFTAESLIEIDDADLVVVNAGCDRSVDQPLDAAWHRG